MVYDGTRLRVSRQRSGVRLLRGMLRLQGTKCLLGDTSAPATLDLLADLHDILAFRLRHASFEG